MARARYERNVYHARLLCVCTSKRLQWTRASDSAVVTAAYTSWADEILPTFCRSPSLSEERSFCTSPPLLAVPVCNRSAAEGDAGLSAAVLSAAVAPGSNPSPTVTERSVRRAFVLASLSRARPSAKADVSKYDMTSFSGCPRTVSSSAQGSSNLPRRGKWVEGEEWRAKGAGSDHGRCMVILGHK